MSGLGLGLQVTIHAEFRQSVDDKENAIVANFMAGALRVDSAKSADASGTAAEFQPRAERNPTHSNVGHHQQRGFGN